MNYTEQLQNIERALLKRGDVVRIINSDGSLSKNEYLFAGFKGKFPHVIDHTAPVYKMRFGTFGSDAVFEREGSLKTRLLVWWYQNEWTERFKARKEFRPIW